MRKGILSFLLLLLAGCFTGSLAQQAENNRLLKKRVILPHGWALTPAGHNLALGELPRDIAVSSSGKYLAVADNGENGGTLQLIETEREKILDATSIQSPNTGMKFSEDEKALYTCSKNSRSLLKYEIIRNRLVLSDSIVPGSNGRGGFSPAGFDIDNKKQLLYLVSRQDHSLYLVDLRKKSIVDRFELEGEGSDCLLSAGGEQVYIVCKGSDKLSVFDTRVNRFTARIPVGNDPNDLCISHDGGFLFVASNEDHSVSVIDLSRQKVVETINASLFSGVVSNAAANALAIGEDGNTLYVANGDNNCISVWDISHPGADKCRGFIPVGWYPMDLKSVGKKLFVANGKGFSSLARPAANPDPTAAPVTPVRYHNGTNDRSKEVQYIVGLFTGSLSIVEEPDDKLLTIYSRLVYQNCPYPRAKELLKQTVTQPAEVNQLSMK